MDIAGLNANHRIPGVIEFSSGQGAFPVAVITGPSASAVVSTYGAHILSHKPNGQSDVLWLSDRSAFEEGKPIRGGIPVCFPWFGPHPSDPQKPLHGFARLLFWEVAGTGILPNGEPQLRLRLRDSAATLALWPHAFHAELIVTVGSTLKATLRCTNTDSGPLTYSDALHSYLAVKDISGVSINGLGGRKYLEGPSMTVPVLQQENALEIRSETNRRYLDSTDKCEINDPLAPRTIHVDKSGSRVTVVWNPWAEVSAKLPDMPDDGYKTMLCVESVNAYDDVVTLAPGESHDLSAVISVTT
jgi:glucose-6-phosphate 1-epimerase